ncbi:MAG: tetratricopeptide repeat protein [Desulfobacula sp.]|uniref:tetratricopeptide repeat protein n=1 Tax=Desulfobacula sp. TaxID=2593537 RepID=UPI0025C58050|nr:tetratricopeptide repeat protein [Desulfobacula sp.]MCD4721601.1 tetratricopeptide repeat protein [Desulfobacula sp.]
MRDSGYSAALPQRALQVLDLMVQNGIGQRPLFFISHSLGGLVMKHILRKASDSINEVKKNQVAKNTKAVLFLATPHWGAELASLANKFKAIFNTTISVSELSAHDAYLEDIGLWYKNHSDDLGIQTVTYYELKPFKGLLIVNSTSANPGVGKDPVGLDEDHISIAKPNSKKDQVCNAARDLLCDHVLCVTPAVETTSTSSQGEDTIHQETKAFGRSVAVQNSPGTQVRISVSNNETSNHSEQIDKLIDITQKQTNVITKIVSQQNGPQNVTYQSPKPYEGDIVYEQVDEQTLVDKYPVTQIPRQEIGSVSSDILTMSRKRVTVTDIAEVIQKLETVEDTVAEIRNQISVWNNDTALLLSERLDDQLKGIEDDACPRLLEYLFLIARVHIIYAENKDTESTEHIDKAKDILTRIDSHFASSPRPTIAADVRALKGSIKNLENGTNSALKFLLGHDDPYSIRIRLAMYIRKQDLDKAITLIEGRPPHLRWCDIAITVYVIAGRRGDALELVKWVDKQKDRIKYPQCVVRLADASLVKAISELEPGKNILPQDLSETERLSVQEVLNDLSPILEPIIKSGSVDSELATAAVKIAWQAHHLLGHRDDVGSLARIMSTHNPVPTDVARSVMSGYMAPPPDLPSRMREDHPDDLDANILATVVESHMGQHITAFNEAKKLLSLADTNEKKEELFKLFQEIWQNLDDDTAMECESIARPLVGHNPELQATFDAMRALRSGNGDKALEALDKYKAEDDVFWLQLRGNALMQMGSLADAVDMFQIAAKRTGAPMLLHKTADLAFQAEKVAIAVDCYEQLITAQPDNLIARNNLASLYTFHLKDLNKAEIQFRELHEAEPGNPDHTVNLAFCLIQLYRPEESLALYNKACKTKNPDLRAVLGRAELQVSIGNPDEAYTCLQQFRNTFWDSPDFLLACMNTSYAAGEDDFAHEAFCKLNKLRSEGLVNDNVFQMVHNDEALTIIKEHFKAAEERKRNVHEEIIRGRMPWTWAAQFSSDAFYWAWRLRTQGLDWIGDDPVNRAMHTVYSTNGFHAGKMDSARSMLLRLECPPPGTKVVADISTLITLHRLDLLDKAVDYFSEILIPQEYLATVLEDGRKMVIHQRSRKRTAEEINNNVAIGSITLVSQQDCMEKSLPVADEYHDSNANRYHLIDVIKPVHEAGLMDDATFERVRKACVKASSINSEHPPLMQLQNLNIELSTLETLSVFGFLDTIIKFYHVHIIDQAPIELAQRLEVLKFQEETREWHFDLWDRICADTRFKFIRAFIPQEMKGKDSEEKDYLAFLASFVAQHEGIPLLADDRVCQVMTLNIRHGSSHVALAFGSDAVVLALLSSDRLEASGAAKAMQALIRWRYRFVLPSAEILKTYAKQYCTNPPGLPLQEIAEYVHDCMRDTGLFGGPEATDAKESMAMRLYTSWINLLAEWLVELWNDRDFSNDIAMQLTEWCVKELLPSQPRVWHGSIKVRFSSLTPRLLITHMLLSANSVANDERGSAAMKAIQKVLEMSDDDYLRIIMEILNDTRKL